MNNFDYLLKLSQQNVETLKIAFDILFGLITVFILVFITVMWMILKEFGRLTEARKLADKDRENIESISKQADEAHKKIESVENRVNIMYKIIEDLKTQIETQNLTNEQYKEKSKPIDHTYWEENSSLKSIAFVDEIISWMKQEAQRDLTPKYLQSYIALGTDKGDYAWFSPRLTDGMCYIMIWVGKDKVNSALISLKNAGINSSLYGEESVRIPSQPNISDNVKNKEIIKQLVKDAYYSIRSIKRMS